MPFSVRTRTSASPILSPLDREHRDLVTEQWRKALQRRELAIVLTLLADALGGPLRGIGHGLRERLSTRAEAQVVSAIRLQQRNDLTDGVELPQLLYGHACRRAHDQQLLAWQAHRHRVGRGLPK